MSNILPFPYRRRQKAQVQSTAFKPEDTLTPMRPALGAELWSKAVAAPAKPLESLEQSLDAHRSTLLELAHRRTAFEMQMRMEHSTAQIMLEVAGYKALVAGVPEDDIYALGEDMAEALHSAMNTVAGA